MKLLYKIYFPVTGRIVVFLPYIWYNPNMDQYGYQGGGNPPPGQYYRQPVKRQSGMAAAAVLMAGLALISTLTCLGPIFFGSLAILFAILSKGGDKKLNGTVVGSIVVSFLSMVAGIAILIATMHAIKTDPIVRAQVDQSFEMMYGVDYDTFMNGMKNYYETGEMPEFMQNIQPGTSPYTYPGGQQL